MEEHLRQGANLMGESAALGGIATIDLLRLRDAISEGGSLVAGGGATNEIRTAVAALVNEADRLQAHREWGEKSLGGFMRGQGMSPDRFSKLKRAGAVFAERYPVLYRQTVKGALDSTVIPRDLPPLAHLVRIPGLIRSGQRVPLVAADFRVSTGNGAWVSWR